MACFGAHSLVREGEAEGTGWLLRDRDQLGGTLPAGAAVEAA
jgi:hypothetical protein